MPPQAYLPPQMMGRSEHPYPRDYQQSYQPDHQQSYPQRAMNPNNAPMRRIVSRIINLDMVNHKIWTSLPQSKIFEEQFGHQEEEIILTPDRLIQINLISSQPYKCHQRHMVEIYAQHPHPQEQEVYLVDDTFCGRTTSTILCANAMKDVQNSRNMQCTVAHRNTKRKKVHPSEHVTQHHHQKNWNGNHLKHTPSQPYLAQENHSLHESMEQPTNLQESPVIKLLF